VLQRLFKFYVAVLDLSAVVAFAKTTYLLPELLEVVRSLHHLELVAGVVLVLLRLASIWSVGHRPKLRRQSLAHLVKVGQKRTQERLVTYYVGKVLHGRRQLHNVCLDSIPALHLLSSHLL